MKEHKDVRYWQENAVIYAMGEQVPTSYSINVSLSTCPMTMIGPRFYSSQTFNDSGFRRKNPNHHQSPDVASDVNYCEYSQETVGWCHGINAAKPVSAVRRHLIARHTCVMINQERKSRTPFNSTWKALPPRFLLWNHIKYTYMPTTVPSLFETNTSIDDLIRLFTFFVLFVHTVVSAQLFSLAKKTMQK